MPIRPRHLLYVILFLSALWALHARYVDRPARMISQLCEALDEVYEPISDVQNLDAEAKRHFSDMRKICQRREPLPE
jgi:hypothetical protein